MKVLLPPSALETLSTLNIAYPMLFSLKSSKAHTHAGVLEFVAAEGHVYLPLWMFAHLKIVPGISRIRRVTQATCFSCPPHTSRLASLSRFSRNLPRFSTSPIQKRCSNTPSDHSRLSPRATYSPYSTTTQNTTF